MKSPKSNAEIQIEEAITHMGIMITKQNIRIEDANYLKEMACNILLKCSELRISRDLAITRRNEAQEELKQLKNLK